MGCCGSKDTTRDGPQYGGGQRLGGGGGGGNRLGGGGQPRAFSGTGHALGGGGVDSGSGVNARDAAAMAALERANASTGAGASDRDRKLAERRQKDELVGKILAHYQAQGRDAPIGLPSSDVPSLRKHLDHIKTQGNKQAKIAAIGATAAI